MLARRCLAPAASAAARTPSSVVRVGPLAQSQLRQLRQQPRLARSQIQFARCLSEYQTPDAPNASEQSGAQKKGLEEEPSLPRSQSRQQDPSEVTNNEPLGRLLEVASNDESVSLVFEQQSFPEIPKLWFRDTCPCAQCVSESSGQKKFATSDIEAKPQLESSKVLEDGSLQLVWARDFMTGGSHTSIYPNSLLQESFVSYSRRRIFTPAHLLWNRAVFEENMEARSVPYDAWMAGGEQFAKGLLDLCQWGLILVRGVPESKDAVKDIANKIGNLKSTIYGETWDVISKPNAENVAYTNEFLCLHQDLMYYYEIPYVQVLHCMKNDCQGGDSLFSDGFRAAAELRRHNPDAFSTLSHRVIPFQYKRNGHFYRQVRPVIQVVKYRAASLADKPVLPAEVHWSPPFQGSFSPFPIAGPLNKWHKAAKAFQSSLEAPENMLQFRLQPGDCVLFDNTRIQHGRTKFDTSSGLRHLRGAYLQKQTVSSAIHREIERGHIIQPTTDPRLAELEQVAAWYGEATAKKSEQTPGHTQKAELSHIPAEPSPTAAQAAEAQIT